MTDTVASPLFERYFLTALAERPALLDTFGDCADLFSEALNMRAYEAICELRSADPDALAESIRLKTQIAIEPKDVSALFAYGKSADVNKVHGKLRDMRNRRKQIEIYQQAVNDLVADTTPADDVPQRTYQEALAYREMGRADVLTSDDWFQAACAYADRQRQMIEDDTLLTFPPEMGPISYRYDAENNRMPMYIETGTMLLFVGKTSTGKSIDVQQVGDWFARRHKHWVLDVTTELTKRHLLWRRLVRLSAKRCVRLKDINFSEALNYEALQEGYKDQKLFKELLQMEGGRIIDWEAGNMAIPDIITMARKYVHVEEGVPVYPDIILDYWDMLDFRKSMKLVGSNDASAIGHGLMALKAYAQETGTIVAVVQQTDKAAHLQETVSAENTKDSINFIQRSNWAESINTKYAKDGCVIEHPISKQMIVVNPGEPMPVSTRTIDKDTFHGQVKKSFTAFRDRFFWMYSIRDLVTKPLSSYEDQTAIAA